MKDSLEFQLELLLKEWQQGLLELDFVGDMSLEALKKRLIRFYDRSIHIEDEDLHSYANDSDHLFSGG